MNEPPANRWSDANPFAKLRAQRLAANGGQHRSPGADSDSRVQRDELACSLARETAELHDQPFPPAPF